MNTKQNPVPRASRGRSAAVCNCSWAASVGAGSLHAAPFIPKPLIISGHRASGRAETRQLFNIMGQCEEASASARGIFREAARSSDPLHQSGCRLGVTPRGQIPEEKHQQCWRMAASAQVPLCFAKIPFNPTPVAFGMGSGGAGSFCQGIKRTHPLKLQHILKRAWEPDTRGPEAPGWLWLYLQGHFDGRSGCGTASSGIPAVPHATHSSTHLVLEGRDCNSTPKTS